jgi:hypothetical protein
MALIGLLIGAANPSIDIDPAVGRLPVT